MSNLPLIDAHTVHRIDPSGCGCTDCIVGYSVPIDAAPIWVFDLFLDGTVTDASSTTEYEFDCFMANSEFRSPC